MRSIAWLLWIGESSGPPGGVAPWSSLSTSAGPLPMEQALEELTASGPYCVFLDGPLPGRTAEEALEEILRLNPNAAVVIRDSRLQLSDAVRLTRLGAHQCIGDDTGSDRIVEILEDAAAEGRVRHAALGGNAAADPWKRFLIGESPAIRKIEHLIRLVGSRRCTVLITGATGTGKEMAARALHMASPRASLPMVAINCSALPENLLEAELFGYVKGAFTGAASHRMGRFEQANRSTLFLDEIGDMPMDLQVKLLRVLQEREFQRLGSSETIKVDVRVIAASNANLLERVRQGKFRQDLYYRLNVVPVHMPTLCERTGDIPLLVRHFIDKLCHMEDIPVKSIGPEALERLCECDWPGNVRELENAVEMAIALSGERDRLYASDFPLPVRAKGKIVSIASVPAMLPAEGLHFDTAVSQFERTLLTQAMQKASGNKTVAADLLGLKRTTLLAKLRTLEIGEFSAIGA